MIRKLAVLLIIIILSGCGENNSNDSEKLKITLTLFPQYDFAREIAGNRADVTLLMPPGTESHSFEPSPKDIISIENSDLFVYTGKYMESWSENIIKGIDKEKLKILDVSKGIDLKEEHGHHGKDPHIWTSPINAIKMVENILEAMIECDSENADYYSENAQKYKEKLLKLDKDIRNAVNSSAREKIVFGGRFAMHYFAEEYGLSVISAYDNCSHETEPGVREVAEIISVIKEEKIPVVYYEELADPKVSRMIAEETDAEMLLMHSCHNLSKEDFENGKTYLSLMEQNLENLKRGIN